MKARDDLYPEVRHVTSLGRVAPNADSMHEQHSASPGLKRTGETNRTSRHLKAIDGHQGFTG
jgi:hypothetical protein